MSGHIQIVAVTTLAMAAMALGTVTQAGRTGAHDGAKKWRPNVVEIPDARFIGL